MHERAVAAAPATRDDAPSLPPSPAAGSGRAAAVAAAGLAAAVAAILRFGAVGHEFYGDFQLPLGDAPDPGVRSPGCAVRHARSRPS